MGLLLSRFAEFIETILDQRKNYGFEILELSADSLRQLIRTLTGIDFEIKLRDIHFLIAITYIAFITKSTVIQPLLNG